jgi:hypothetical protein
MSIADIIINATAPHIEVQLYCLPDSPERTRALNALDKLTASFRAAETFATALTVELAKYGDNK